MTWSRSSFAPAVYSLAGLVVVVAALTAWQLRSAGPAAPFAVSNDGSLLMVAPVAGVPERLVYPFSVVEGGVASAEEALEAAQRDAVVRAHYSDIALREARMSGNPRVRFVHVSYRKGDRIYWTRNKVRLPEGEPLLTDGENAIRARCGNRIAGKPLGEVEPPGRGPGEGVLDTPILDKPEGVRGPVEPVPSTIFAELAPSPEGQGGLTLPQRQLPEPWWQPSAYATPVSYLAPNPAAPNSPTPLAPVAPAEVEPDSPEPTAPVKPNPTNPAEPEPEPPVSPDPEPPVSPEPEEPTEPKPVTPTPPKPPTPTPPKPGTPVEPPPPVPGTPGSPTPALPTPWTPGTPIPVLPPSEVTPDPNPPPFIPPEEWNPGSVDDPPAEPAEVPEPPSLVLAAIGLAGIYFGSASRRRVLSKR